MSTLKPVALGAGAESPAASREEKKKNETPKVPSELVQTALVDSLVNTSRIRGVTNPDESAELFRKIVALEPNSLVAPFEVAPFSLNLTDKEAALINGMFAQWALHHESCLLELWGVDLSVKLEQLLKYLPQEDGSKVLEEFCAQFWLGYVSLCGEKNKPAYALPDGPSRPEERTFLSSRPAWIRSLEETKKTINRLIGKKSKIRTVSDCLKTVERRLDLGIKFLSNPQASVFLCDVTLGGLEAHFPEAIQLDKSVPEKTLADLITLARFITHSSKCAVNRGYLGVTDMSLNELPDGLLRIQAAKEKLPVVRAFKKEISSHLRSFAECREQFRVCSQLAAQGSLSQEKYYSRHGVKITNKKSQREFANQLHANYLTSTLIGNFLQDFLQILDARIMVLFYPDDYVPTRICGTRFNVNLGHLFQIIGGTLSAKVALPPLPMSISAEQTHLLETLVEIIHGEIQALFVQVLRDPSLIQQRKVWTKLNALTLFHLESWLPFIQNLNPILMLIESLMPQLNGVRERELTRIEGFFRTFEPKVLHEKREEWIQFFQQVNFNASLEFCRVAMINRDARAIADLNSNLSAVDSDEGLLADEVVDFMMVQGIEKVIRDLVGSTRPAFPMRESTKDRPEKPRPASASPAAPAVAAPAAVEPPKAAAPALPAPLPAAPAKLHNRDAEKVERKKETPTRAEMIADLLGTRTINHRKLLQRLKALGVIPDPRKRRGSAGGHQTFVTPSGQKLTVPFGSSHEILKPKTFKSIVAAVKRE